MPKRVVFPLREQVCIEDFELMQAGETQLLVRNIYSLVSSGTEIARLRGLTAAAGTTAGPSFPCYPGYCSVGEVVALGDSVEGVALGDYILHASPHAEYTQLSGGFERNWVPIPAGAVKPEILLARIYQIVWTAIHVWGRVPTACTISGAGLLGISLGVLLKRLGCAEPVVLSSSATRRDLAIACGLRAADREAQDGGSLAMVIESTGRGEYIADALRRVRPHGGVILLGSPREPITLDLYGTVHRKGIHLLGAHEGLIPFAAEDGKLSRKALLQTAVKMIAAGELNAAKLVENRASLQDVATEYARLSDFRSTPPTFVIDWRVSR